MDVGSVGERSHSSMSEYNTEANEHESENERESKRKREGERERKRKIEGERKKEGKSTAVKVLIL